MTKLKALGASVATALLIASPAAADTGEIGNGKIWRALTRGLF